MQQVLEYYLIESLDTDSYWADIKFVSDLKNLAKQAFPFAKRSYRILLSQTEAEKLSDAIYDYEWEDEVWKARPKEERAALLEFEERIENSCINSKVDNTVLRIIDSRDSFLIAHFIRAQRK